MKNVLFEFLDTEPIENYVTSFNFKIDKCIFFGYEDCIRAQKKTMKKVFAKYCEHEEIVFVEVPRGDLQEMTEIMREAIRAEKEEGSNVFFDITGGETLPLIAFGRLSREFDAPMHIYNIPAGRIVEIEEGASKEITETVPRRKVEITVPVFIEMRGGVVNENLQKDAKSISESGQKAEILRLFDFYLNNKSGWTKAIVRLRNCCKRIKGKKLWETKDIKNNELGINGIKQSDYDKVLNFLKILKANNLITIAEKKKRKLIFKFNNDIVEECLTAEGTILELYTCLIGEKKYDDCKVGVHVDWDGEILNDTVNVLNELDVFAMDGYCPTVISCKAGVVSDNNILYELGIIADRFGGKFARKVLVTGKELSDIPTQLKQRAKEMNIEILPASQLDRPKFRVTYRA